MPITRIFAWSAMIALATCAFLTDSLPTYGDEPIALAESVSVDELAEKFNLPSNQVEILLKIIEEGKQRSQVMGHLSHLCLEIGPRLTGSTRLETANRWTAERFESFGLKNVEVRQWGELPVRFDRGPSTGEMLKPVERKFEFTTRSWSAGTNGPVEGVVLREPQTEEQFNEMAPRLAGAWILRRNAKEPNPFADRLLSAGIAGMITASADELVRTGGVAGIKELDIDNLAKEVSVLVRRSDYDAMNSRLADGEEVVVKFDLNHRFERGPIPLFNTIAEIPGTEKPDEVVIISAHLDSWDGPGSQGTVDNGTGSSVTIEAARILAAVGVQPKRTIRFILWSGEEQGLLGSSAYVDSLSEEERAKISAVFVDDSGTNQQSSLSCVPGMEAMFRQAIAPMNHAFPDAPLELNISPTMPRGGASDHASFNRVGVPGFFWGKTGRAFYRYAWHTQNDKIDQAVPEYLIKNATVSAIVAYVFAEAETLLPRPEPEAKPTTEGTQRP
ncbi:MAG: M20/M25/M40 family metallo-hydrolase [Planctomycetaceae bacterium]|nr:M20/M25/M40 family metallo-hydrolase [Planctomycetaceae bacterium]